MKKIYLSLALLFAIPSFADVEQEKETISVQELFSAVKSAYDEGKWKEVEIKSQKLLKDYPVTAFAKETLFYLGVSTFNQKDYQFANRYFSKYLKDQTSPRYFEQAMQYKFDIAQEYADGAKKHLMGFKAMPKWIPATSNALKIFNEIIATIPHHDLAARSLFKKGEILLKDQNFKESLDSYQTLIRRFPSHSLAIESYLSISKLFLKECQDESPDPALMDLAQLNLRKFEISFPGEERIEEAVNTLLEMKETYAMDLFETGKFYERIKKGQAAVLYYKAAISKYPETKAARRAGARLEKFEGNAL
jgi:outer membrane protein assembly factor BamD (BamD/ComL family)